MEPVMQEIMAEVNGRYNLSNILDVLDKLRRAKRIDIDMYDKVYKQIITESRNDGDKWYQRYIPLKPKQLKELNSLNFSFDVKTSCDENNPNQTNRIQPSKFDKVQKFTSPTTFASPPTFETRASRLTDFQSDYQKELTNQILQQISDGKRRSAQSDYIKSEKQHKTNRTISSFNINSLQQLISVVQRKIMQHYRLAFNKIIFLYNEPVKLLQDVEIQAEPSKVAKFSLKDSFQIEKEIQQFKQNQTLKILFYHFDNLKQNWLRKKRIKNSRNQVLLMRKHNYLWRAFNKMRKYSIKHKQNRLKKVQADHFYSLNQLRIYFEKWINFHLAKQNKNSKNKISSGLIQLKNQETLKACFIKFKLYYQHRRDKHQNNLLAYGLYQQKLQKLYFTVWNSLVMNQQKRETNQFIMKKCFKKWKQYLQLKDFNRKRKQTADNLLIYQNKRKILRILKCFHIIIKNKNNYKKQLNDVYLFHLLRKGFKGFALYIEIKEKKKEQYQQIGRFLQILYISKPFNILQQYTKEQKMKKELNSKARAIYKVNKLRRLTNFWLNWAKEKKFHRKQDITNIPQIKQFQIYLYFNKYRLAFQRSLWLKNLVRIMRSKHQKEFVKELKLNNIRFKQENKYPLKLKQKVIRGLRINLINHLKKQQFYKQLLSLHQHNIIKHIFDCMKIKSDVIKFCKQIVIREVCKEVYSVNMQQDHFISGLITVKNIHIKEIFEIISTNCTSLRFIKSKIVFYIRVFKILNDYKWKKKIQKVQDQKNLPIIVYKQKVRFLKFWNAKRLSKGKIENFCVTFTNLQQRIFFKHMQVIQHSLFLVNKSQRFLKEKVYGIRQNILLNEICFQSIKQIQNVTNGNLFIRKKLKQRNNTEIIKKRQLYHLKSNSFKHMRRLFTFEQNVAYLTAITVLQIKKNLLQKYFKGFKDLIANKKRPRDQVMKINKLRKCFAGWKVFTSKQQGAKLMIQAIWDIQRDQKLKLFKKLDENNRIENAKLYYKQNLMKKVLLYWFDSTQSSQKTIYLTKVLNKLRFKQLKKQFLKLLLINKSVQVKHNSLNVTKRKILKMWASKLQKLKKFQRFLLQMSNKGKDNMIFSIQAIKDNSKEIEIQEKQQNLFLFKYFQQWKKQYQKSHSLKTIIFSIEDAIKKTKSCVLNRMKKMNKDMKVYQLCSKMQKQRILHKWLKQLNQIGGFNKLQNIFQKKENEQFYKKARKLFVINKQFTLNSILSKSKLSRLFQRWDYLSKMNLKIKQFESKLENILKNKIYYQHCQSVLFYHLQSYQIKQLKGEFALKTFNKLVQNKQYAILGHLQQDSIYYNYLEQKNIRKQIICLTLWAKLTNESVAYKFICKSLGEIYKRNMYYNLKIIKQFGDKNQTIFKQIDDKKKQKTLLFWFFQSQKRIAAKSIYNILEQNYDSKQNKMLYVVKFMEILSQNQMKTEKANKYYDIFNSLIKKKMQQAFTKVLKSSKQQYLSKCKRRKLQKQYLKQWRINKAVITFNKILGISYERNLSNYFNKVKSQIKNKQAELHYQSRIKYQLLQILQQVKNNTNKKFQYLSSKQNNNLVIVYFQMWIIKLLKRTNQRKQFMKIFRGFYLYHYRTIGAEFIKQLKLEKKLQIKSEQESQHSLMYSVFQAWRMEVDQKKMLKKYLQQCSVEEKRGKSIPKNMPY